MSSSSEDLHLTGTVRVQLTDSPVVQEHMCLGIITCRSQRIESAELKALPGCLQNLPTRGQKTKTNARTCKGKRVSRFAGLVLVLTQSSAVAW